LTGPGFPAPALCEPQERATNSHMNGGDHGTGPSEASRPRALRAVPARGRYFLPEALLLLHPHASNQRREANVGRWRSSRLAFMLLGSEILSLGPSLVRASEAPFRVAFSPSRDRPTGTQEYRREFHGERDSEEPHVDGRSNRSEMPSPERA